MISSERPGTLTTLSVCTRSEKSLNNNYPSLSSLVSRAGQELLSSVLIYFSQTRQPFPSMRSFFELYQENNDSQHSIIYSKLRNTLLQSLYLGPCVHHLFMVEKDNHCRNMYLRMHVTSSLYDFLKPTLCFY